MLPATRQRILGPTFEATAIPGSPFPGFRTFASALTFGPSKMA
jgi:hypothetical protein